MRIVYLVTTLGMGGAEKQAISLAERMHRLGHTVMIVVLRHSMAEEWPVKLPVLRLNLSKTPKGIWLGLGFAANFLRTFEPDILHSHTFPANMLARMLRMRGIRCVLINTIHNVYEGGWHRMALYRLTDPWVDKVTAVSERALERYRRTGAVTAGKLSLITNGIDLAGFGPDTARRKRVRRAMGASDSFVWIAVGRLAPAKDYPNLLRAFAAVRAAQPGTKLWIAGEGFEDLDDEGLGGVQFLGLRRDIADLMDAADGYVLSSAWEGMPLALGEAMAMAKPVVTTDAGGSAELVADAGLVVGARDSEALAAAMLRTMAMSDADRMRQGKAARERIRLYFSMDAKTAEWEQNYMRWLVEADA